MIKFIAIIFVLTFIYNCTDVNTPQQPEKNEDDLHIDNRLLGKWKFNECIRQFNDDGTFYDSIYSPPNPWGELNICTELDSNGLFLNQVVYGKYEVKDGILMLQPIDYVIDCNPLRAPACYIYYDKLVNVTGDTLKLTTFLSWHRTNNNSNNIWGSWESNYWVWAYHSALPQNGAPQYVKDSITFYEDSTIFHQKIIGYPYSGILWRIPFTYNPPILNIILGDEDYEVSIKGNEMQWLSKGFTYNYTRL